MAWIKDQSGLQVFSSLTAVIEGKTKRPQAIRDAAISTQQQTSLQVFKSVTLIDE